MASQQADELFALVLEMEPMGRRAHRCPIGTPLTIVVPASSAALPFQLIEHRLNQRHIILNWENWK